MPHNPYHGTTILGLISNLSSDYLNQPKTVVNPNTQFNPYTRNLTLRRKPPTNPNTRNMFSVNFNEPGMTGASTYLGATNPIREDQITYMKNPNLPSGLAADLALSYGNTAEALGTGYNMIGKYITDPLIQNIVEPAVSYAAGTPVDIARGFEDADTKFDPVVPGAVGDQVPSLSSYISKSIDQKGEYNQDKATGKFSNTTVEDKLKEQHYAQKAKDWEEIGDWGKSVWGAMFPDAKEKDKTQSNTSAVIATGTNNPALVEATSQLSNAVDNTDKTEEGWQSGITNGINNFINRLGDPGFQTALAMHMEARGGGDITDVLFAGVNASNKAKSAMFQSQKNELELMKLQVQIGNLQKPKEASKADIGAITSILTASDGQFELSKGDAALAAPIIAGRVEVLQGMGMDQGTAIQQAIQEAVQSGQLKGQDTASGLSKFFSFLPGTQSRGSFDLNAPSAYNPGSTNIPLVTNEDERNALPSGSLYQDINGLIYTKP
jgi:hypothetical protein